MSIPSKGSDDPLKAIDDARLSSTHYKWTMLAAMGDFLDAGAIVAGGASLVIWESHFALTATLVGLIGALSPNAFAAWLGALIAGPLGDRYGRKAIYTYDLVLYAIGTLIMTAAVNYVMLIIGYIMSGVAVGVDVPTSWSLIAEYSPRGSRGRLMSFTNIFWYVGPIVILLAAIATVPIGVNSFRVLFGILTVVAAITWFLRRSLIESPRWAAVKGRTDVLKDAMDKLGISAPTQTTGGEKWSWSKMFRYKKGLALVIPIYILWGIPAGTFGFFLEFFERDVGGTTLAAADLIQVGWFVTAIIALLAVYIPLADRVNRRTLYVASAALCALSFAVPIFLPFKILAVALFNVLLFGFGQGVGLWPLNRMWSVELFPTEIRNTAQGFVWAWMRFAIGVWSIFVPSIVAAIGYSAIAAVGTAFFIVSIVIVLALAPASQGKSLEQVLRDFYGGKAKEEVKEKAK
ncbi:MFS transporter [Sulfodiicoccus acidiphilus]|nr:MFS transporter [Sulfodiicoccus acidiphilus]